MSHLLCPTHLLAAIQTAVASAIQRLSQDVKELKQSWDSSNLDDYHAEESQDMDDIGCAEAIQNLLDDCTSDQQWKIR